MKKSVVSSILLVVALLVAYFSFYPLLSQVTGGNRDADPVTRADPLDPTTVDLTAIPLPDFPFPNFTGLDLDRLPPELLEDLMDYMSNPDSIDPSLLEDLMNDEQLAQMEVFRVFDYDFTEEAKNSIYWRHCAYDAYQGSEWGQSVTSTTPVQPNSMATQQDYYYFGDGPLYRVKIPVSTSSENELQMPVLFPGPHYVGSSIQTTPSNILSSFYTQEDDYNDATLSAQFSTSGDTNLTYNAFRGEIASDAYLETHSQGPSDITGAVAQTTSRYMNLPDYASTSNFRAVVSQIQSESWLRNTTSIYAIAYDLARYMMTSGEFTMTMGFTDTDAPDMVEEFCRVKQGNAVDFASAFTLLCRYFDVPARFVSGYHTRLVSEESDPVEGENTLVYKYRDMYAWAEVFVYLDDGTHEWKRFDLAGMQFDPEDVNQNVLLQYTNASVPLTHVETYGEVPIPVNVYRGNTMTFVATVLDQGTPDPNRTVQLVDMTTDTVLGTQTTDVNGQTGFQIPFNGSWKVGGHYLVASSGPAIRNSTVASVNAPVEIEFTTMTPEHVYRNESSTVVLQGNVYDPGYTGADGQQVENARVNVQLWDDDLEAIEGAFSPNQGYTNASGNATITTLLDDDIRGGTYNVSLLFTNLVRVQDPYTGTYTEAPLGTTPVPSEQKMLKVTDPDEETLLVTVNDQPIEGGDEYLTFTAPSSITIQATYIQGGLPQETKRLNLYHVLPNGTRLSLPHKWTNSTGEVTFDALSVDNSWLVGPHVFQVERQTTAQRPEEFLNATFAVLDKPLQVTVNSSAISSYRPGGFAHIYRSGTENTTFDFFGKVVDPQNGKVVSNMELSLTVYENDEAPATVTHLDPDQYFTNSTPTEYRFTGVEIDDAAEIGEYNVTAKLTGKINVSLLRDYVPGFDELVLDCGAEFSEESTLPEGPLFIDDPDADKFWFYVDAEANDVDTVVTRGGLGVSLKGKYLKGTTPQVGTTVEFYALDPDTPSTREFLGSDSTDGAGEAEILFAFNPVGGLDFQTGVYLLEAELLTAPTKSNYSYVIVDGDVSLGETLVPDPVGINKSGAPTTFTYTGTLYDGNLAGNPGIRNASIELDLWEGVATPRSTDYFAPNAPTAVTSPTGAWSFAGIGFDGPMGFYNISADFTGTLGVPVGYLGVKPRDGQNYIDLGALGIDLTGTETGLNDLPVDDHTIWDVTVETNVGSGWEDNTNYQVGATGLTNVQVRVTYTRGLDRPWYIQNVQFQFSLVALDGTVYNLGTPSTNAQGTASVSFTANTRPAGMYLVHVNRTSSPGYDDHEDFMIFTRATAGVSFTITGNDIFTPLAYGMYRGASETGVAARTYLQFDGSGYQNGRVKVHLRNDTTDYSSSLISYPSNYLVSNATGGIWAPDLRVGATTSLQWYYLRFEFNGYFDVSDWATYDRAGTVLSTFFSQTYRQYAAWGVTTRDTFGADDFLVNADEYTSTLYINGNEAEYTGSASTGYADYTSATPVRIGQGSSVTFTLTLYHGILPVQGATLRASDVDTGINKNSPVATNQFGQTTITFTTADTATWRVGARRFEFEYVGFGHVVNHTIVMVTGTTTVAITNVDTTQLTRGVTTVTITGTLEDGGANRVPYARVTARFYRSNGNLANLLDTYLGGGAKSTLTTATGTFSISFSVSTALHQREYYLKVEFNQSYQFDLSRHKLSTYGPYIGTNNSDVVHGSQLEVWARSSLSSLEFTPTNPLPPPFGTGLVTVEGTVAFQNGTGIDFTEYNFAQYIRVLVYNEDHTSVKYSRYYAGDTDNCFSNGNFQVNLYAANWTGTFRVYVEFNPAASTFTQGASEQEATGV